MFRDPDEIYWSCWNTSAVSNMNVWIVALYEREESKQVTRRLGIRHPACKVRMLKSGCLKRMLAYLLTGILRMPGKMHGNDTG